MFSEMMRLNVRKACFVVLFLRRFKKCSTRKCKLDIEVVLAGADRVGDVKGCSQALHIAR